MYSSNGSCLLSLDLSATRLLVDCAARFPHAVALVLLSECCTEYAKLLQDKTSTIILHKSRKRELLKDIGDILDPVSQQ